MSTAISIRGRCDAQDRLIEADEPLAGLQTRCGGELPGVIAIPALLALARRARLARMSIARSISAMDDGQPISFWVKIAPDEEGARLECSQWRQTGHPPADVSAPNVLLWLIAEAHLLLDDEQRVLTVHTETDELAALEAGIGKVWSELVKLGTMGEAAADRDQPLHWRLLDDASFTLGDAPRRWRSRIQPRAGGGFELLIIPETIVHLPPQPGGAAAAPPPWNTLLGRDLAPALRQPINRIIANAETIRTRLAGPLADEYAGYAGDIAEAGRHLLSLVEDLADLDALESPGFSPAPDRIDLADCARRAAGILSVRAKERAIALHLPPDDAHAPAIGEYRRVLQILLNLLSNAIRYTPGHTAVSLAVGRATDANGTENAWIAVSDQGDGLTEAQMARVFEKFERLGRSGDGGSGLGLYISRRLARAMQGDLRVTSSPGTGASFVLSLPADRA
ncbi:HAMP domain-containing sensor histidine kinase [Novosphingobium sp. Chol11]|uniref:sensor histidine kinase n=1 Tax=Novosphingobium sp. Chol11 TaxID=1385763 RepID=UPI0025D5B931|nr:HAMP domain-containing sensor histidine kinase [Novosphingobium sp. Chol11]